MKTEQEVREAITEDIEKEVTVCTVGYDGQPLSQVHETKVVFTKEEVQDLAVIIGKALGIVK